MSLSIGMMTLQIYGKIKNVPNHQPVLLVGNILFLYPTTPMKSYVLLLDSHEIQSFLVHSYEIACFLVASETPTKSTCFYNFVKSQFCLVNVILNHNTSQLNPMSSQLFFIAKSYSMKSALFLVESQFSHTSHSNMLHV